MIHIPHPTVESLLQRQGGDRQKARRELVQAVRAAGARMIEEAVQASGRSPRCQAGDHRTVFEGVPLGCANDGSTCICNCHDEAEGSRP